MKLLVLFGKTFLLGINASIQVKSRLWREASMVQSAISIGWQFTVTLTLKLGF